MAKTVERKVVLCVPDNARIIRVKIADDGKSAEIVIENDVVQEQQTNEVKGDVVQTQQTNEVKGENFDEIFPIIDPSELVGHKLLKHEPKNKQQKRVMAGIRKYINLNLPAFRVPYMDPSEENGKIVFKPGNKPALGHSALWWQETWKNFMPSKNSRNGTDLHWYVFLGIQIKCLIEEHNYSVEKAWKAICDDKTFLYDYKYIRKTKRTFSPTGGYKVGQFFDLTNTSKILQKWEKSEFLLAGGNYIFENDNCSFAFMEQMEVPGCSYYGSVGWLVMDV